jgi:hypothetical protein
MGRDMIMWGGLDWYGPRSSRWLVRGAVYRVQSFAPARKGRSASTLICVELKAAPPIFVRLAVRDVYTR